MLAVVFLVLGAAAASVERAAAASAEEAATCDADFCVPMGGDDQAMQMYQLRASAKADVLAAKGSVFDTGDETMPKCTFKGFEKSQGYWHNCQHDQGSDRCDHYRKCVKRDKRLKGWTIKTYHGKDYCSIYRGCLTDPPTYLSGTEMVTKRNAAKWNYLWAAAAQSLPKKASQRKQTALMCNPVCKRSQDLLHIHAKVLSKEGEHLRDKLGKRLCHKSSWVPLSDHTSPALKGCQKVQARRISRLNVFTDAVKKVGDLQGWGVSVWNVDCGEVLMLVKMCMIEKKIFKPGDACVHKYFH